MEETGLDAATWIELGFVHPNTGILESTVALFAARIERDVQSGVQCEEVSEFRWFDVEDVEAMIGADKIRDVFTMSALLRARLRRIIV